jgi:hypothetical protein
LNFYGDNDVFHAGELRIHDIEAACNFAIVVVRKTEIVMLPIPFGKNRHGIMNIFFVLNRRVLQNTLNTL